VQGLRIGYSRLMNEPPATEVTALR
jgi:hypothetical protein